MLALLAHAAAADLSVAASDRGFRFRSDLSVTVTDGPTECAAASKVKAGDKLKMHYTGTIDASSASGEKGKQFDSSRDRGATFDFEIGAGRVIQGCDEGLVGLCKGAKATLIIPPALGYGDRGAGADIPGGATLRFDVEVVDVAGAPPTAQPAPSVAAAPAVASVAAATALPAAAAPKAAEGVGHALDKLVKLLRGGQAGAALPKPPKEAAAPPKEAATPPPWQQPHHLNLAQLAKDVAAAATATAAPAAQSAPAAPAAQAAAPVRLRGALAGIAVDGHPAWPSQ